MKITLLSFGKYKRFHRQRGGPLAALALLASAAGTGMQMAASSQEQAAMEDKTRAELLRQKGFQKKSTGEFQKSLAGSGIDTAKKQMGSGSRILQEQYTKLAQLPTGATSASESIPVSQQVEGRAQAQNQASQANQANLGGISEWDINQWIKNLRAQQQLGLVSSMARSSQAVLPYELQHASQSAEGLRAAGTGVSLAGSLAGLYGAMNPGVGSALTGAGAVAANNMQVDPAMADYPITASARPQPKGWGQAWWPANPGY